MNKQRGLTMLSLSVALHTMLVLAVGALLIPPERILQHIEVDLKQAAVASPGGTGGEPSPAPGPAEPPQVSAVKPEPKPVAKPVERRVKPRPVQSRPIIATAEPAEQVTAAVAAAATGTPQDKTPSGAAADGVGQGSSDKEGSGSSGSGDKEQSGKTSVLQAYLAAVRARIEAAKRYPFAAEQRRIQGVATVRFRLSPDGGLLSEPTISTSSGFSILDRAALQAVQQAAPFPRFPGPVEDMPKGPLSVELKFMMR
jgi:protein TonB